MPWNQFCPVDFDSADWRRKRKIFTEQKLKKKLTALKEKNDGCGIIPAEGKGSSVGPWHPGKNEVGDTVIK